MKERNEGYEGAKHRFTEIKFISYFVMDIVFHADYIKVGYFNNSISTQIS